MVLASCFGMQPEEDRCVGRFIGEGGFAHAPARSASSAGFGGNRFRGGSTYSG